MTCVKKLENAGAQSRYLTLYSTHVPLDAFEM